MAREPTIRLTGKSTGSLAQRAGSGDISEVTPLGKRLSLALFSHPHLCQ